MEFAKYSEDIFAAVLNPDIKAVGVLARAGSGKTTTIVESIRRIPLSKKILCISFNKHIADEMVKRINQPNVTAATLHSFAFSVLKAATRQTYKVANNKYANLIYAQLSETKRRYFHGLVETLNLSRLTGKTFEEVQLNYDVDTVPLDAEMLHILKSALAAGRANKKEIDFTDMIEFALDKEFPIFDYIFVDESQDLNYLQHEIVKNVVANGAKLVAVGDDRQAIYGFSGAFTNSFQNLVDSFHATVFPLPISYRCPTSHITKAKAIVKDIEAASGAKEGTLSEMTYEDLMKKVSRKSTLILCRYNAPLVALAFGLIKNGVPAKVRGRNIANSLVTVANDIYDIAAQNRINFMDAVEVYKSEIEAMAEENVKAAAKLTSTEDKLECVKIFFENSNKPDRKALSNIIKGFFNDDDADVVLSSIHRAKGLESENVYVLFEESLIDKRAKGDALVQEHNLSYVAFTRSKDTLTMVTR